MYSLLDNVCPCRGDQTFGMKEEEEEEEENQNQRSGIEYGSSVRRRGDPQASREGGRAQRDYRELPRQDRPRL